jgi:EutQ-like cupin domain
MAKASKATASEHVELGGYEGHFEDFGPYTVAFETYTADAELAPLFVGLPDDRCQCPHMGHVLKGKVKFTFADGTEETYEAGDAYYAPPGHVPTLYAGTEVVEFSPTAELQQTMAVVERNMAAAGSA